MYVNKYIKKNEELLRSFIKNKWNVDIEVNIEKATVQEWDFYTNISFKLAKMLKKSPIEIGKELENIAFYKTESVKFVPPGFLNFKVSKELLLNYLNNFSFKKTIKNKKKLNIEFISANPTGPLNVVSGRAASFGEALSALFEYEGYEVTKEYYINDAGNQVNVFANSLYKVYREVYHKEKIEFSDNEYQAPHLYEMIQRDLGRDIAVLEKEFEIKGENGIFDIYVTLLKKYKFLNKETLTEDNLMSDLKEFNKKEIIINYLKFIAIRIVIENNKKLLSQFGVNFDVWFSEKELYKMGYAQKVLSHLEKKGLLYEKDGALFVKNSVLGDTQDWVLRKSTGEYTYFFGDIMYHLNKFERGFDRAINIWGPDHQGSAKRLKIILNKAFNLPQDFLEIIILQQVNLIKNGKKMKISKRFGNYITLKEILKMVGNDVARFYFLSRGYRQHIDFSLDIMKQENEKSIIYYLQYMFARINGVVKRTNIAHVEDKIDQLFDEERDMAFLIFSFPLMVKEALTNREPQIVIYYLNELAKLFHKFYENNKIIGSEKERHYIAFIKILRNFVKNSLNFLGFNAPEKM